MSGSKSAVSGDFPGYSPTLMSVETSNLLQSHGFSPKALRMFREALAEWGEAFADERPE